MGSTPENLAKKAAAAMLGAAESAKRSATTQVGRPIETQKPQITESPFGKPYVAPVEIQPGREYKPGTLPEEIKQINVEDVDAAFGDMQVGNTEGVTEAHHVAEETNLAMKEQRRVDAEKAESNTEYEKNTRQIERAKQHEQTMSLARNAESENSLALAKIRGALGIVEMNKYATGKRQVEFTPGAVAQLAALHEKAQKDWRASA